MWYLWFRKDTWPLRALYVYSGKIRRFWHARGGNEIAGSDCMHGNEILKLTTQRMREEDRYIVRLSYLLSYLQAKSSVLWEFIFMYTQRPFFISCSASYIIFSSLSFKLILYVYLATLIDYNLCARLLSVPLISCYLTMYSFFSIVLYNWSPKGIIILEYLIGVVINYFLFVPFLPTTI